MSARCLVWTCLARAAWSSVGVILSSALRVLARTPSRRLNENWKRGTYGCLVAWRLEPYSVSLGVPDSSLDGSSFAAPPQHFLSLAAQPFPVVSGCMLPFSAVADFDET